MAINKIPEAQLPTRSVSETDYVRVVGADGKSYRVPKTDFNGGGGGGTIDPALSPTSTNAVQNKAIYNALSGLNSDIGDLTDLDTTVKTDLVSAINEVVSGGGGALTQDTKQALLQCFAHTVWTDDQGQTYYDDLEDALYPFDLLSSITAVYTQSGTVYDTDSLDSLKSDLVVTGQYSDNTSNTIRNYTLSGTLTAGTSTITVTYGGKTATFTVTVTQSAAVLTSITCVYTQSGTVYDTDSLDSLKTDLVVTAHYSDSTTETVASSDYTLSGTLTVGTSTITVTYLGETTTFTVTVTEYNNILYRMPAQTTFNGSSNYIDTDIKLADEDKDYTIAFTAINGTVGTDAPIFHCVTEVSPWKGISFQRGSGSAAYYSLSGVDSTQGYLQSVPITNGAEISVVIRHTAGSDYWYVDSVTNGTRNSKVNVANTTHVFRSSDKNLLIGCYQNTSGTKGRFWSGTINDFAIYSNVWTDAQVSEYFEE